MEVPLSIWKADIPGYVEDYTSYPETGFSVRILKM